MDDGYTTEAWYEYGDSEDDEPESWDQWAWNIHAWLQDGCNEHRAGTIDINLHRMVV